MENNQPLPRRSSPLSLTPIMIEETLRSNTRLRYSNDLPVEVKFPFILPRKNHVTKMIVKYYLESEGHRMGVNYTINHLREKFSVIHVRQEIKRANKECSECARHFRIQPAQQQTAPLPQIRLQMTTRPFTNCAVDFAGPYLTVQGRGRTRTKRYLCLFLCLQTHCCYLEMATSLETGAFLNVLCANGSPERMADEGVE